MLKTETARQIRAFLNEIYNRTGKHEDLDSLSDEELMRMARNLQTVCRSQRQCSTVQTKSRFV